MFKVGITGGIGSGKTTVSKVFAALGIPVFYADIVAAKIIQQNADVINQLKAWYGELIYVDGLLNKERLAAIIFNNETERLKVNGLIHPIVISEFNSWADKQDSKYVMNEAALHFESGNIRNLNKIITVKAPETLRINRILKRDNRSEEMIRKIIAQQLSDDYKIQRSDFVIDNSENTPVIPQVLSVHHSILSQII